MPHSSDFSLVILAIVVGLLIAVIGAVDIGFRWGGRRAARNPETVREKVDAVQTTLFSLLSLILAFVFSGAAARFEHRQDLVIEEANAIATSYLRVDLLPTASQPELRELFRNYVSGRIALFERFNGEGSKSPEFVNNERMQNELWRKLSAAALATGNSSVITLVHNSANVMIDSTASRLHASRVHPPKIFYAVLFGLILAAAFLVGCSMSASAHRPWTHIWMFALVLSATMYVILDFEYPRYGLVRIETADQSLADVLSQMH
jgi:hypothetical protein